MKVEITYFDDKSFTAEEVVRLASHNYGKDVKVQVIPDSFAPHDLIAFAIQQMITPRQLELLYDNKYTYQTDIKMLRAGALLKLEEILDTVIIDNESRIK